MILLIFILRIFYFQVVIKVNLIFLSFCIVLLLILSFCLSVFCICKIYFQNQQIPFMEFQMQSLVVVFKTTHVLINTCIYWIEKNSCILKRNNSPLRFIKPLWTYFYYKNVENIYGLNVELGVNYRYFHKIFNTQLILEFGLPVRDVL